MPAVKMFTAYQREYLDILRRRIVWIEDRIAKNKADGRPANHYEARELAATKWAVEVLELVAAEATNNPGHAQRKDEEARVRKLNDIGNA